MPWHDLAHGTPSLILAAGVSALFTTAGLLTGRADPSVFLKSSSDLPFAAYPPSAQTPTHGVSSNAP
jgi:hypothetical protein